MDIDVMTLLCLSEYGFVCCQKLCLSEACLLIFFLVFFSCKVMCVKVMNCESELCFHFIYLPGKGKDRHIVILLNTCKLSVGEILFVIYGMPYS